MSMTDCDKYGHCNAPICPLDPNHLTATHCKGEKVCFYLQEAVKPHADARFGGAGRGELYRAIAEALPGILARYAPIRRALRRAAQTPARFATGFNTLLTVSGPVKGTICGFCGAIKATRHSEGSANIVTNTRVGARASWGTA